MKIKYIACLFFFLVLVSFTSAVDTDGLIGYWSFDDESTSATLDSFQGLYNLTVTGATPVGSCKLNSCYEFADDGSDDRLVSTTLDNELITFNTGTVCYWKLYDTDINAGVDIALSDGDSANDYMIFQQNGASSDIIRGDCKDATAIDWETDSDLSDEGNWDFVCFVQNGTSIEVYINGYVSKTVNTNTDLTCWWGSLAGATDFSVGAMLYTSSWQFELNGKIDELGIWNISLDYDEIEGLYNSGNGCNPINETCFDAESPTYTLTLESNMSNIVGFNETYYPLWYNGSYTNYVGLFNCTLYNSTNVLNNTEDVNLSIENYFNVPIPYGFIGNFTQMFINCSNMTLPISDITLSYNVNYDRSIPPVDEDLVILESINQNVTLILQSINNIEGEVNMFSLYLLYLGVLAIGVFLILNYNFVMGVGLVLSTLVMDIYFITVHSGTLLIVFVTIIFIKFASILFLRSKKNRSIILN